MTMNFKGSLNITDKVYVGTAGADIFIANDNGDTVVTDGGGDNITLGAAGHADRVELYVGTGAAVSSIVAAVPGSITDSADVAKGGFWGLAGGVGQFGGLATGHGTSTDMTKIFNFQSGSATGADVIDLSASAWGSGGTNGEKGTNRGLVNGNLLNHPTTMTFASLHINGTVPSSANMIRLVDRTFADANAVAQALSSNYKISLGASLPSLADCHMLFAYNDSSNYARIADVEFNNNSYAASSASTSLAVHASDLVQITGISMSQLYTNNLHFVT